jgi:hypothetical protein
MDINFIIRSIYYIIKRIVNALDAFFDQLLKPISFLKGDDFEKCLRKKVFTKAGYDMVMRTHDFHVNNQDYVESSLYPDFLFRDKKSNKEFFVEAKYRENLFQGKVNWCKDYQLRRYRKLRNEISAKTPIIIAIGLGGRPDNPKQIFLIPLEEIKYSSLYPKFLLDYEYEGSRKNMLDGLLDKVYDFS